MSGKRKKPDPPDKEKPKRRRSQRIAESTQQKTAADGKVLVHPTAWFNRAVADDLWMPNADSLQAIEKNSQHPPLVDRLLTSWFDVTNFTDVLRATPWRTMRLLSFEDLHKDLRALGELSKESKSVNSVIKLRLYPTTLQREKLEQMFAANRAVYNKLVARSKEDCAARLVLRGEASKNEKMTLKELAKKYRPISQKGAMSAYFRNKKMLRRHLQVNEEVYNSAFRDFKKAIKSSLALFFALKKKNKNTTFPELKFKSKFAPSNTIELRTGPVSVVVHEGKNYVRFHRHFFGFGEHDRIELREALPQLTKSIRLQRLREGEYYLAIPRLVEFEQTKSNRVCAIDPGVRNFATIYDPDGRTISVKDAYTVLKRRFEAIDAMKSKLVLMDNESKAKHETMIRQRKKIRGKEKTQLHRQRYPHRRFIRFTHRRVTRMVNDMHQKLSSWLATNYKQVLLPSFNTSEMVRKYEKVVAADGTPPTSSDEVTDAPAQPKKGKKREIRTSTARAMLAQSHYKFKMLLKYKMERAGGRMIECEEEYTSKTCSSCGKIKENLGGNSIFRCSLCHVELDRDVNAAKNIFHKNMQMLC